MAGDHVADGMRALATAEAAERLAVVLRGVAERYRLRAAELRGEADLQPADSLSHEWEAAVIEHAAIIADQLAEECGRGAEHESARADRIADAIAEARP